MTSGKDKTTARKGSGAIRRGAKGAKGAEGRGKADAATARARRKKLDKEAADSHSVEKTADGHYVVIDGRRWRATNPDIPEERRQELVNELMRARREVGRALRAGDREAEREARRRVHECKVALGERGAKWWEEEKG